MTGSWAKGTPTIQVGSLFPTNYHRISISPSLVSDIENGIILDLMLRTKNGAITCYGRFLCQLSLFDQIIGKLKFIN